MGGFFDMERVKRIELSYAAWEAAVLPLNYTRLNNRQYSQKDTPLPALMWARHHDRFEVTLRKESMSNRLRAQRLPKDQNDKGA